MKRKRLKKVVIRISMKDAEIFNTNKEIISKSIEISSGSYIGVVGFDPELLKTGMIAS